MSAADRLDAIEARANAATEGPWARFSTHRGAVQMVCPDTDWYERQHVNDVVIATLSSEPTAEFIAHARTDVPALVAALREVLALDVPFECADGRDVEIGAEHMLEVVRDTIETALTPKEGP